MIKFESDSILVEYRKQDEVLYHTLETLFVVCEEEKKLLTKKKE